MKGAEAGDMAAQEVVHALIEIKAQEDLSAEAQHHDEGHQWAFRTTDLGVAEVAPVNLAFFTWQGLQA